MKIKPHFDEGMRTRALKTPKWALVALLLLLGMASAYGQHTPTQNNFVLDEGTTMAIVMDTSGLPQDTVILPFDTLYAEGKIRLIIQLNELSVAEYLQQNPGGIDYLPTQAGIASAEQEAFIAEMEGIEEDLIKAETVPSSAWVVRLRYTNVLNGIAVDCWAAMLPYIKASGYVKKVEIDAQVHTTDATSFSVVGLPCFQSGYTTTTGTGKNIGIIDTGIDAGHPDFGSRVVDWFDFAMGAGSPVDPIGHGTHVAGIAAAGGSTVPGMAPDANITAYRVFTGWGFGLMSWVIGAMDRSTDPNGDFDYTDRLDVINLSLGGPGDAGSLAAIAADDATILDVVVVAAMGNSGPGYFTTSVPAAAFNAIGVGASDNSGNVASFSSRGPGGGNYFNLKPDIMAPGVGVNSTYLSSGYTALSGTSMSTPTVAGAALLLRELYPGRTPAEIKAMLMQTATSLGAPNYWTQGSGQLNICNAPTQYCSVTPASSSLGLFTCGSSSWVRTQTFTIHNYDAVSRTYSLSISSGSIPGTGTTLALSTPSLVVGAGSTGTFVLTVTVTSSCPDASPPVPCYIGYVNVSTTGCSESIPFSFAKLSTMLEIDFDIPPVLALVHDGTSLISVYINPPLSIFPLLVAGTYDIMALFPDYRTKVVLEGVTVTTCPAPVQVFSTDAIYDFPIDEEDHLGNPLTFMNVGVSDFVHSPTGIGIYAYGGFSGTFLNPNTTKVNGFSSDYVVDIKTINQNAGTNWSYYDFPFQIQGPISSGATLLNSGADFVPMGSTLHAWPGVTDYYALEFPVIMTPNLMLSWYMYGGSPLTGLVVNSPWVDDIGYYGPNPTSNYPFTFNYRHIWDISSGFSLNNTTLEYDHAFTSGAGGGDLTLVRDLDQNDPCYHMVDGMDVYCGYFAPRWMARTNNTVGSGNTTIRVMKYPQFGFFGDQTGDIRNSSIPWVVKNGSSVTVGSGTLTNSTLGAFTTTLGTFTGTGNFTATFTYTNYEINGVSGTATTKMSLNSAASSTPNVPWLHKMYLRTNELPGEYFLSSDHNELIFQVEDEAPFSGFASVAAAYSVHSAASWNALSLTYDGGLDAYHADFPCDLTTNHYDVRITVTTNNGQTLEYKMEPAFYFDNLGSSSTVGYQWVSEGGGSGNQVARSVSHDGSGNVITAGDFTTGINFTGGSTYTASAAGIKSFVAKYDAAGNIIWDLVGTGSGTNGANGVCTDPSGNIYVCGYFTGAFTFGAYSTTSTGNADMYVAKISSGGTVQWLKTWGSSAGEIALDIVSDGSGKLYFTGQAAGTFTFGGLGSFAANSSGDIFVASLNTSGTEQWMTLNISSGTVDYGQFMDIQGSDLYVIGGFNGNLTIASTSLTNAGNFDNMVVKYDASTGSAVNVFQISSANNMAPSGIDVNGNVMTVGASFTSSCNVNGTGVSAGGGLDNGLLANLNASTYAVNWAHALSATNAVTTGGVGTDGSGGSQVAVNFTSAFAVTGLTGVTTTTGSSEIALVGYDNTGTALWIFGSTSLAATTGAKSRDMHNLSTNQMAICGDNGGGATGGSTFGSDFSATTAGGPEMIVVQASGGCESYSWSGFRRANPELAEAADGSGGGASSEGSDIFSELSLALYPNPASGIVNLRVGMPSEGEVLLTVHNMVGAQVGLVQDGQLNPGNAEFTMDRNALGLADGVYFVRLQTAEKTIVKKLVLSH